MSLGAHEFRNLRGQLHLYPELDPMSYLLVGGAIPGIGFPFQSPLIRQGLVGLGLEGQDELAALNVVAPDVLGVSFVRGSSKGV